MSNQKLKSQTWFQQSRMSKLAACVYPNLASPHIQAERKAILENEKRQKLEQQQQQEKKR